MAIGGYDSFSYSTASYTTEAVQVQKNYTADMVMQKANFVPASIGLSSVFQKLNIEHDIPIDLVIAKVNLKQYNMTVVIAKQKETDVTADMVIAKQILRHIIGAYSDGSYSPKSYTVYDSDVYTIDMIIEKLNKIANTIPADMVIELTKKLKTYIADMIILATKTTNSTSDIILQKVNLLEQYIIQMAIQKLGLRKDVTIDAVFAHVSLKQYGIDMVMVKDQSTPLYFDLYVRRDIIFDVYVRRDLQVDLYCG